MTSAATPPDEHGPPAGGVAPIRTLVVAAHPDYEALALDELARSGFQHRSLLVTSVDGLSEQLAADGALETWDIVLVIDTPDGPRVDDVLEALAARQPETPVLCIGRGGRPVPPAALRSVRAVELRALGGVAAEALREADLLRERRRGAVRLRDSEMRFATAFDSAPIGLALIGRDGVFVDANPEFCRIAGVERSALARVGAAEVAAHAILAAVTGTAQRVAGAAGAAAAAAAAEPVVHRVQRPDGSDVWLRISAAPARGEDGTVLYLVAYVEDVTAARLADEARARSEAIFAALFSSTNVGICVVDEDGSFLEANRAYQEILGYSGAELRTLTFQQITHPEDVAANMALRDGDVPGERTFRMEKRYVRKDGSVVWVDLSGAPLHVDGRRLAIGAVVDITDRVRSGLARQEAPSAGEDGPDAAGGLR